MNYTHTIGSKFGKLTVTSAVGIRDKLNLLCDCGNSKVARLSHLRSGSVKSCGCLLILRPKEVHGTYLASRTLEYKVWDSMNRRCHQENHHAFSGYGGRGIFVCDRWRGKAGFGNFMQDMGSKPVGHSLDRIDNNGGYSPENCRWSDRFEQSNNRRSNKFFEIEGVSKTLAEWSQETGISDNTMRERLKRGWDLVAAIQKPVRFQSGLRLSS